MSSSSEENFDEIAFEFEDEDMQFQTAAELKSTQTKSTGKPEDKNSDSMKAPAHSATTQVKATAPQVANVKPVATAPPAKQTAPTAQAGGAGAAKGPAQAGTAVKPGEVEVRPRGASQTPGTQQPTSGAQPVVRTQRLSGTTQTTTLAPVTTGNVVRTQRLSGTFNHPPTATAAAPAPAQNNMQGSQKSVATAGLATATQKVGGPAPGVSQKAAEPAKGTAPVVATVKPAEPAKPAPRTEVKVPGPQTAAKAPEPAKPAPQTAAKASEPSKPVAQTAPKPSGPSPQAPPKATPAKRKETDKKKDKNKEDDDSELSVEEMSSSEEDALEKMFAEELAAIEEEERALASLETELSKDAVGLAQVLESNDLDLDDLADEEEEDEEEEEQIKPLPASPAPVPAPSKVPETPQQTVGANPLTRTGSTASVSGGKIVINRSRPNLFANERGTPQATPTKPAPTAQGPQKMANPPPSSVVAKQPPPTAQGTQKSGPAATAQVPAKPANPPTASAGKTVPTQPSSLLQKPGLPAPSTAPQKPSLPPKSAPPASTSPTQSDEEDSFLSTEEMDSDEERELDSMFAEELKQIGNEENELEQLEKEMLREKEELERQVSMELGVSLDMLHDQDHEEEE